MGFEPSQFSSEYYNAVPVFFVENFSLESIVLKYNDENIFCAVLQNGKYGKITILSKRCTFLSCFYLYLYKTKEYINCIELQD